MSWISRRVCGAWTIRPRACRTTAIRRGFSPDIQLLEGRQLLSTVDMTAPTDVEQYMLQLVNRVRANPAAEGRRLVSLALTDPALRSATSGWDLNRFLQVISSYPPEPPLAFNSRLIAAARDHSMAMLAANSQFHAPSGFLTNPTVAQASDGQVYYPTGNNWWSTGENIFAYSQNVTRSSSTAVADYFEAGFLLDWGNPDFGHLKNILAPGPDEWSPGAGPYPYSEIGIGLLQNVTANVATSQGLNVGPDIVSQEFGWRSGNPILTGAFFTDNTRTGFYAPGEGIGGVTIQAVGRGGEGVFATQSWPSGGFSLALPSGNYDVSVNGNIPYPISFNVSLARDNKILNWGFDPRQADQPIPANFGGGAGTTLAVYRPGTSQWFIDGQSDPIDYGGVGIDVPLPGDYDGVGHAEPAVYRPGTGEWFMFGPTGPRADGIFGAAGLDIPVPGDYDGLGHIEPAVYRPTTGQWFVRSPGGDRLLAKFGSPGLDIPVPGNYDGSGRTVPAVYRPLTGEWFVLGPDGSQKITTLGAPQVDIPVPGDYDGVGHLEPAVYRPTTGQWFILGPAGVRSFTFGAANLDIPLRGDFDGDGKSDPAVFRPSTGQWFARLSGGGEMTRTFGNGGASTPVSTWINGYAEHPSPQISQSILAPLLSAWARPGPTYSTSIPSSQAALTIRPATPPPPVPTPSLPSIVPGNQPWTNAPGFRQGVSHPRPHGFGLRTSPRWKMFRTHH
ncbi:MAG: hypothetical protein NVSMB9_00120 [Isosphaeraceae bacterium]